MGEEHIELAAATAGEIKQHPDAAHWIILKAIRAAVAEERAACAQVARDYSDHLREINLGEYQDRAVAVNAVAALIEARCTPGGAVGEPDA